MNIRYIRAISRGPHTALAFVACLVLFTTHVHAQEQTENSRADIAQTVEKQAPSLKERFGEADTDNSGALGLEEALASVKEADRPQQQQRFLVCDFDKSGELSEDEFAAFLDHQESLVSDPVRKIYEQHLLELTDWFKAADADRSGDLSAEERKAASPTWVDEWIAQTDWNENGLISLEEFSQGVAWAFGITTLDGTVLRNSNDRIFHYRTYLCDADDDRDGALSVEEAQKRFSSFKNKTPEEIESLIERLDRDGNDQLSVAELAAEFSVALIYEFQKYDTTLDGKVSPEELAANASKWMQAYVPRAFPAYDLDADQSLSFQEFRLSPFGNSGLRWPDKPVDRNEDGVLDLKEFHPENTLGFLGISRIFFDALDLNHDGFLNLHEYDYKVDAYRVSPEHAISILDQNGDRGLSLSEFYGVSQEELLSATSQISFANGDSNTDGVLTDDEFRSQVKPLQLAMKLEHALQKLKPQFQDRDADGNQRLSLNEVLAGIEEKFHPSRRQLFVIADEDSSHDLNLTEFLLIADRANAVIADPVVMQRDEARNELETWFQQADGDSSGDLSMGELKASSEKIWLKEFFSKIDFNSDEILSWDELETGLAWAYGVQMLDGTPLRSHNGTILNYRTYVCDADDNRDGVLSQKEFEKRLSPKSPEDIAKLFTRLDKNHNDTIEVSELIDEFSFSLIQEFQHYDKDFDGFLSPDELVQNASKWKQPYVPRMFPAYDRNADGMLSFHEFQLSPIGTSGLRWTDTPQDHNHDGKLELSEFHPEKGLGFLGHSRIFFQSLDLNHDGSLTPDEYDYKVDLFRIPIELVFALIDVDDDGGLSMSEVFPYSQDGFAFQEHQLFFQRADVSGDQSLSEEEFQPHAVALRRAMEKEQFYKKEIVWRIAQVDKNKDGQIDQDEVREAGDKKYEENRVQRFLISDFDHSGLLDTTEFAVYLNHEFAVVPDPVFEAFEQEKAALLDWFATTDVDQSNSISMGERDQSQSSHWMSLFIFDADQNKDELISQAELLSAAAWAFGVETLDGVPIRLSHGQIFNYRTYICDGDRNNDGVLSLEEAQNRLSNKTLSEQELQELIQKLDTNDDQQLTILELMAEFVVTPFSDFQKYDSTFDGQIALGELQTNANQWMQPYVPRAFPAYDLDQDRALSFREFRLSPFGNSGLRWTTLPVDRNRDAKLDLAEFHPDKSLGFLGVSWIFFNALDLNDDGYLDLDEYDFKVDPSAVPPEQFVARADTNGDGSVSTEELKQRFSLSQTDYFDRWYDVMTQVMSPSQPWSVRFTQNLVELNLRIEHQVGQKFEKFDLDQDGLASTSELSGFSLPENAKESRQQRLAIADVDADSRLTPLEFTAFAYPGVFVPDPLLDHALQVCEKVAKASSLNEQEIRQIFESADLKSPTTFPGNDKSEIIKSVLVGFGIIDPQSNFIRQPDGRMLNLWSFRSRDKDHDGRLAKAEFLSDPNQTEENFTDADLNVDGYLEPAELIQNGKVWMFWSNSVSSFLQFDHDQNGSISPQELRDYAKPYQRTMCNFAIPAFDLDRNGELSFQEFRQSLISNPYDQFSQKPKDLDQNGRLSVEELSSAYPGLPNLYASLVFQRLDVNGDRSLGIAEMDYKFRFRDLPSDEAFSLLDRDSSGDIGLQETMDYFQSSQGINKQNPGASVRLMRIEDAFYVDDKDTNGMLSRSEFASATHLTAAFENGGQKLQQQKRRFESPQTTEALPVDSNWKFWILVSANVLLVGGVGYWVLRK